MLRLATRGSALARTQSQWVADRLGELGHPTELLIVKTTGDLNQQDPLNTLGGKGIFTKEIEVALLERKADLAVHSLKDLPTEMPEGLVLAATPPREDPRDALVARVPLRELAKGTRVGTGSLRRQAQIRALRPDLEYVDIRGNVPTRVQKWRDGEYGAVVLAVAGIRRLGWEVAGLTEAELHPLEGCVPAPCQGILGLQCRVDDAATFAALGLLNDPEAELAARAERAFLAELQGGCHVPAGALLTVSAEGVQLQAVFDVHGVILSGTREEAEELGRRAARELKARC